MEIYPFKEPILKVLNHQGGNPRWRYCIPIQGTVVEGTESPGGEPPLEIFPFKESLLKVLYHQAGNPRWR